ncbi:hypothetical protein C8R43DRAFT_1140760 [Mycena crocata]|nr:hypothetical protein C8R43DRAFT_1140760 [Mycena crocata]
MPRSRAAADAEYALDAVYIACPFIFAIFLNMKQERRYWKGLLTASTTAAKAALKLPWYRPSTVCRSENAKGMYLKNPVRIQVSREFSFFKTLHHTRPNRTYVRLIQYTLMQSHPWIPTLQVDANKRLDATRCHGGESGTNSTRMVDNG